MAFVDKLLSRRTPAAAEPHEPEPPAARRLSGVLFLALGGIATVTVALALLLELGRPAPVAQADPLAFRPFAITSIKQKLHTTRISGWVLKERQSTSFHGEMDNVTLLLCQGTQCQYLPTRYHRANRPLPQDPDGRARSTAIFSAGVLNTFFSPGPWQLFLQLRHNGRTTRIATDETVTVE